LQRHHFLLRRLHSLTGVIPIGAFLIIHLTTNSSVVWGALNGRAHAQDPVGRGIETFQHEVSFINNLPLLLLTEIMVLWLPIAFHSVLGVIYAVGGSNNIARYPYQDNKRYALQRLSGYVGFVFILYHVATLRWGWHWLTPSDTAWSHHFAASTLAAALKGESGQWSVGGVVVSLGYFIGVSALVFHLANGLWTAAITWGLTISTRAQRQWGGVCAALGLGLMLAAWSSLVGFLFLVDHNNAREIEQRLIVEKYGQDYLDELLRHSQGQPPEVEAALLKQVADRPYPGPPPRLND
jgi:succinate dehydrogenase / fumarate reductase cytochrome b subunit